MPPLDIGWKGGWRVFSAADEGENIKWIRPTGRSTKSQSNIRATRLLFVCLHRYRCVLINIQCKLHEHTIFVSLPAETSRVNATTSCLEYGNHRSSMTHLFIFVLLVFERAHTRFSMEIITPNTSVCAICLLSAFLCGDIARGNE